jgi:hypothetical protein
LDLRKALQRLYNHLCFTIRKAIGAYDAKINHDLSRVEILGSNQSIFDQGASTLMEMIVRNSPSFKRICFFTTIKKFYVQVVEVVIEMCPFINKTKIYSTVIEKIQFGL